MRSTKQDNKQVKKSRELRDVQRRSKREKDEVWNSRISVSGSDPTNHHHDY